MAQTPQTISQAKSRTKPTGWVLVAVLCVPVFLGSLDLLVVSAFLPELLRELALPLDASGQEAVAWLVNGYLIAYSIALLAMGRLSDLIGWRSALTICLGLYFTGSLLVINYPFVASVLSPLYGLFGVARNVPHANLHAIILARVIAAFGAGAMASIALSLVSQVFDAQRRALAIGIIAAMDTIGWMFGGFWGGVVVQFATWKTVFIINMPLILGALFLLRRQLNGLQQRRAAGRFDIVGFALATVTLIAVNLGIAQVNTDSAGNLDVSGLWLPLVFSAVLFIVFVIFEVRQSEPIVRLTNMHQPRIAAANLINILIGGVLLITLLMLPIFTNVRETGQLGLLVFFSRFTDQGLRQAALIQGVLIGAFAVPLALSAVVGGWLYDRLGVRGTIALGVIASLVGVGMLSLTVSTTTSYTLIALAAALTGLGIGMAFTAIIVVLLDAVPESERGAAAALTLSLRMVAMSVATSLSTAFITQRTIDLVRARESPNALLDSIPPSQYATSPFATAYISAINSSISELFAGAFVVLLAALITTLFLRDRAALRGRSRRMTAIVTMLLILLCAAPLSVQQASAQETSAQDTAVQDVALPFPYAQQVAAHIPADVEFFAAGKTDADAIAVLDRIFGRMSERMGLDQPMTVAQMIEALANANPLVARLSLLKPFINSLGFAIHNAPEFIDTGKLGDEGSALYVVGSSNAMGFIRPIVRLMFSGNQRESHGDYEVYSSMDIPSLVALSGDHLIYAEGQSDALDPDHVLADNPRFQAALRELPRNDYSAIAYGEVSTFLPLVQDRALAELLRTLAFSESTDMVIGMAVDETDGDATLIADLAQTGASDQPLPTVHPDFARFVPADAAFLVQSTSLGALLHTVAALYASISTAETPESAFALLEGFSQRVLARSLEADILPTLTSDYLLAVDYHALDLLTNTPSAPFPVEFVWFMEADTDDDASSLVESLYSGAHLFLENRSDVQFRAEDHSVQIGTLDVVVGQDGRIVYFGTRAFAQQGLSQRDRLDRNTDFLATTQHALDSPQAIAYMSGRGFGELTTVSEHLAASLPLSLLPIPTELLDLPQVNPAWLYTLTRGGLISLGTSPDGARLVRLALRLN